MTPQQQSADERVGSARSAHSIRVPDHIWSAAAERAERDGTTVSAVIVAALREYGRGA